jgi:hypothetical protein
MPHMPLKPSPDFFRICFISARRSLKNFANRKNSKEQSKCSYIESHFQMVVGTALQLQQIITINRSNDDQNLSNHIPYSPEYS